MRRRPTSSPSVTVRRVRPADWKAYREVRLRSLRVDPLAFGNTFAGEAEYPDQRWKERTTGSSRGSEGAAFVAVSSEGRFRGLVAARRHDGVWGIFAMWVDPRVRGCGVGGRLLDRALSWCRRVDPTLKVTLDVNPHQRAAVGLYLSRGFTWTSEQRPLGHTPGEIARGMRRGLSRPSARATAPGRPAPPRRPPPSRPRRTPWRDA